MEMRRKGWRLIVVAASLAVAAVALWRGLSTPATSRADPTSFRSSEEAAEAPEAGNDETDPGTVAQPGADTPEETHRDRDLTAHELKELEALRERLERDREEWRAKTDEIARQLESRFIEAGLLNPLPLPPEVAPPEVPTVGFALPRALAWLAAHQRGDGRWDGGLEPTALATRVFVTDPFLEGNRRIPALRITLRGWRAQGDRRYLSCSAPREMAVALYGQCALVEKTTPRGAASDLQSMIERLVSMRNRDAGWGLASQDGLFDAIATGWAIMTLQAAIELRDGGTVGASVVSAAKINWSALSGNPEADAPQVIAALLRRRAVRDDPEDKVIRWLSRRLAADLATKRERSLDEWYLGAMALKPDGAAEWKEWCKAMTDAVLRAQRRDGSWSGEESEHLAERVRATALAVLCLRAAVDP
ncbi:MAG: prenyltransferase/squalene oxidase repeat-containing protein [Planctomycetota bacterium]|jgi:hypothetical protein